ncbi:hypothetical protein EV648_106275 [Kribbella sp. VKM Ac-2568]|nr:hypothetical protein EV648_106275 [Kribbella sp. VKM Ac-2568]
MQVERAVPEQCLGGRRGESGVGRPMTFRCTVPQCFRYVGPAAFSFALTAALRSASVSVPSWTVPASTEFAFGVRSDTTVDGSMLSSAIDARP